MTRADAERLGWTFDLDGEPRPSATREDGFRIEIATDGDALPLLLLNIAEQEGVADESAPAGYRPLTDGEILSARRAAVQDGVAALLAGTDKWAARAYEDGAPMSDERKAYRAALRAAYKEISTSDEPESVALPEPPAD